jgi:hypothetical protein
MEHERKKFDTPEEKLYADAMALISIAEAQSEKIGKDVDPLSLSRREDDNVGTLGAEIARIREEAVEVSITEKGAVNAAPKTAVVSTNVQEALQVPRQLTPEQTEEVLAKLAARFATNENLHKGVEWTRVKASLEAKPEALWSVNEMEKAGHEPDVYNFDNSGFDIGTCSKESPESGRNCVYNEVGAEWIRSKVASGKLSKDDDFAQFNSSAVAMAKAMGIKLMDPDLYQFDLQRRGIRFDEKSWCWLLTKSNGKSLDSYALRGQRGYEEPTCDDVYADESYPISDHDIEGSWRGSLRVKWAV